jgi:small-conductance mechanosensitive channel
VGWLVRWVAGWLQLRLTKLAAGITEKVKSRELRRRGLKSFVSLLRTLLNLITWLLIAFLAYTWLIQVMRCFPYLRPWGEYLHLHITNAELSFGRSVLNSLPGLAVVVVIVLAARMLSQIVKNLFSAVEEGDVETHLFDIHTASTTRRIIVFVIWVAAVVVAYPYIPGSDSLAFKGITVFAGLVFSFGSSNIVSQVAGGLVLIYSRAFRTGDSIRFGDIEGTVIRIGLTSTDIRNIKNEEMHIPNNVLAGGAIKNYSRLADLDGLFLTAKVSIGYATPWRQVAAMLQEAARRTAGLLPEPKPFVLQTALADFYVEYELNARLTVPGERAFVLAKLYANILDVFNEHGVQIMSPHYLADPTKPHVVPPKDWYLPPAQRGDKPT